MILTKEMMDYVECEVRELDNQMLLIYYTTHKMLNEKYPNTYYRFRTNCAFQEILKRGLDEKEEKH